MRDTKSAWLLFVFAAASFLCEVAEVRLPPVSCIGVSPASFPGLLCDCVIDSDDVVLRKDHHPSG